MMKLNPTERPDAVQVLQLIRKLVEKQQERVAQTPPTFVNPLAVISRLHNRLVPLAPRSAEVAWPKPKALPRVHSQSAVKPKPLVPLPTRIAPNRSPNPIVEVVCLDDSENSEDQRQEIALHGAEEKSPAVRRSLFDAGVNGCGVKMQRKQNLIYIYSILDRYRSVKFIFSVECKFEIFKTPVFSGEVSSGNKIMPRLTAANISRPNSAEQQRNPRIAVSSVPGSRLKRAVPVQKHPISVQYINDQMVKHIEACIERDRKRRAEVLGKRKVEAEPDEILAPNPPKLLRLTPECKLVVSNAGNEAPADPVQVRKLAVAQRNGFKRLLEAPMENLASVNGAAALERKRHVSHDIRPSTSKIPRFVGKSANDVNNNDSSCSSNENEAPKRSAAADNYVIDDCVIEIAEKLRSNPGKVSWQIAVDLTCGKISKTQIAEALKIVLGVARYEQARDKLLSGVYEHANDFMVQLDTVEQDEMVCLMLLCR